MPGAPSEPDEWRASWAVAGTDLTMLLGPLAGPAALITRLKLSVGGAAFRIRLANRSSAPLIIAAARARVGGTDLPLTFSGSGDLTLDPSHTAHSDTAAFALPDFSEVEIELSLPRGAATVSGALHVPGLVAEASRLAAPGGETKPLVVPGFSAAPLPFLEAICVPGPPRTGTLLFGDSLTRAYGAWAASSRRRSKDARPILNLGLDGARLLRGQDGFGGPAGEPRLEEALAWAASGASHAVVMLGLNDIMLPGLRTPFIKVPDEDLPDDGELIAGLRRLADRLRRAGLEAIGSTITPFQAATDGSRRETLRRSVNASMRRGLWDRLIDAAQLLSDPADAARLAPQYAAADGVHLSEAGCLRLGEAINRATI